MTSTYIIYGLINPIDNALFYIGYSKRKRARLNEHQLNKKNQKNPLKYSVINKIKKAEKEVDMIELESTPYTKDNILIKNWDSVRIASETLNLNKIAIQQCCNGRIKTSGGYKWEYKI